MIIEPEFELRAHKTAHEFHRIAARKLFLGLSLKLRVNRLGREHKTRPREHVLGEHFHVLGLQTVGLHKSGHGLKKPVLETGFVRAALRRRNQVHIAFALCGPLGRPDHHPGGTLPDRESFSGLIGKARGFKRRNIRLGSKLREQIFTQPAFVLPLFDGAGDLIGIGHFTTGQQHGLGAQQPRERRLRNLRTVKVVRIGPGGHPRAGMGLAALTCTQGKTLCDLAVDKTHVRLLPLAPDGHVHPRRERIGHRHPHAVQTARKRIRPGAVFFGEFAAGMQLGEDEFNHGDSLLGMNPERNTTTVILNTHGTIGVFGDINPGSVTSEHLVTGVINDFLNDVKGIVGEGVHPRTLLDRLQPFKHLNRINAVVFLFSCFSGHIVS